jgi:hypothetical protein
MYSHGWKILGDPCSCPVAQLFLQDSCAKQTGIYLEESDGHTLNTQESVTVSSWAFIIWKSPFLSSQITDPSGDFPPPFLSPPVLICSIDSDFFVLCFFFFLPTWSHVYASKIDEWTNASPSVASNSKMTHFVKKVFVCPSLMFSDSLCFPLSHQVVSFPFLWPRSCGLFPP